MLCEDILIDRSRGGIVIRLDPETDFHTMKQQLKAKVQSIDGSLMGALVEIDIGNKLITRNEAREMEEILAQNGLQLRCIASKGRGPAPAVKKEMEQREPLFRLRTRDQEFTFSHETVLVKRNLRSGQHLHHPGNIVIMGDINPGAEVVAGGSILVMGALRGMAHAGAEGDSTAVVAALKLCPTQLRIANHITRSPDGEPIAETEDTEIAYIKDGKVVIEKFKI
ncbi:MAG: septum site-determining protein MinC [Syntrophomonadaceae bacterium]|nr:septum site-determining protein MinC [Syntrophomonadaceae bacterium]